MKKILLLLAFILPMACSFVACSSDDEPEVTELTEKEIQMFQGNPNVSRNMGYRQDGTDFFPWKTETSGIG